MSPSEKMGALSMRDTIHLNQDELHLQKGPQRTYYEI